MLLSKLTKLHAKGLTPDQIVNALRPILYFDTLTLDEGMAYGHNRESVLFEYVRGQWRINDMSWGFWGTNSAEIPYYNNQLGLYACMPVEDYKDGILPDRVPQPTR